MKYTYFTKVYVTPWIGNFTGEHSSLLSEVSGVLILVPLVWWKQSLATFKWWRNLKNVVLCSIYFSFTSIKTFSIRYLKLFQIKAVSINDVCTIWENTLSRRPPCLSPRSSTTAQKLSNIMCGEHRDGRPVKNISCRWDILMPSRALKMASAKFSRSTVFADPDKQPIPTLVSFLPILFFKRWHTNLHVSTLNM
jgi:hypothetical protein